jgi:hypothetical protein
MGIREGSQLEFTLAGDHIEVRVKSSPVDVPSHGFAMLKSKKVAVPADFDVASLIKA